MVPGYRRQAASHPPGQVVLSPARHTGRAAVARVGILGDYDGNGKVDVFDAANWEGDQVYGQAAPDPLYHEAIVYKLFMDAPGMERPTYRYADCLPVIQQIHQVSGGKKQIVYLVGWQHTGHDTGYPCHTQFNPRVGTGEELVQLMEEAKQYNCIVSLHGNLDDSYREFPEHRPDLLSRDPYGEKVWFANGLTKSDVLSISHTLANESGYNADRARRMLDLIPIRESLHFDAHRPYNEVWLPNGEHISAECEVQRGLIPIQEMFRPRGSISPPKTLTTRGGGSTNGSGFSRTGSTPTTQRCTTAGSRDSGVPACPVAAKLRRDRAWRWASRW